MPIIQLSHDTESCPEREQQERHLVKGEIANDDFPHQSRRPTTWNLVDSLSILGLVCAACIAALSARYPTDMSCAKKLSTWSPMTGAMTYEWRTLTDDTTRAVYSGPPSEGLEKAWFELWAWGATAIQLQDLPKLNKLEVEKNWTILPPEVGGGVKAHIQVFHYLHCVDTIRQFMYRNEWNYSSAPIYKHGEINAIEHIEHCIEVLRIQLVCIADVTPYPVSISPEGKREVHANARYKCPVWSGMTTWADDNAAISYDVAAQS